MEYTETYCLDLIIKYSEYAAKTNTVKGYLKSAEIVTRKKTPFLALAGELCKLMRKYKDKNSMLLGIGFVDMYNKNKLPSLTKRLVDDENVRLFELYYIKQLSKEDILNDLGIDDERTMYKKLKRSNELFAIAVYDFVMFVSK